LYDIAVVGAGINGCAIAYELTKAGKKVALFDIDGIASGGSGAAGAFISPKFSKSGELKELLHDAFLYSMKFYEDNFPDVFTKLPLLHIAQDEQSSQTLRTYKQDTKLKLLTPLDEFIKSLKAEAKEKEQVCIDAGLVDAAAMCNALCSKSRFIKQKVETLIYQDDTWIINDTYSAKEVVLATGAYEKIIKEPYIQLRGVWGHRIDVKTSTKNPYSIHQFVSISSNTNGVIAIGATHNVHYHPETSTDAYNVEEGRVELLEKASKTLNLEDTAVIKDYMGLRSGSFDYIPLVGPLVISSETLQNKNIRFHTKKPDITKYSYYPNLYMINGSGGYGFVLAPYLANILKEHIINSKEISQRLQPARFFARWAKKNCS